MYLPRESIIGVRSRVLYLLLMTFCSDCPGLRSLIDYDRHNCKIVLLCSPLATVLGDCWSRMTVFLGVGSFSLIFSVNTAVSVLKLVDAEVVWSRNRVSRSSPGAVPFIIQLRVASPTTTKRRSGIQHRQICQFANSQHSAWVTAPRIVYRCATSRERALRLYKFRPRRSSTRNNPTQ